VIVRSKISIDAVRGNRRRRDEIVVAREMPSRKGAAVVMKVASTTKDCIAIPTETSLVMIGVVARIPVATTLLVVPQIILSGTSLNVVGVRNLTRTAVEVFVKDARHVTLRM
jgi:hypothetical protein